MKLLVLDGNSILNRAFYGIKILSTKNGEFTNGIYGFLNILEKIKDETKPEAVAIAFDLKAPTFRHKMYDAYKANRKGMPQELAMQLPILKDLLTFLGYKLVSCEGYEADDILGTLAKVCEKEGHDCVIATGDRDSLQLVSKNTSVRLASTKFGQSIVTFYDEEKIMEVYGVEPKALIDIKAIQGDSSDNIPGVLGIGEKGAKELITKFQNLNYIYDNIEDLDIKKGMKEKLINSKDNAFLSYELGTINTDAPIDKDIKSYVRAEMNTEEVSKLMQRLELFKLMEKLGVNDLAEDENVEQSDAGQCEAKYYEHAFTVLPMLEDFGKAYFSYELAEGSISKMCFSIKGKVVKIKPTKEFITAFCSNEKIEKYTHDLKPLYKIFGDISAVKLDTLIAAYLLNPSSSSYDTEKLAFEYGVKAVKGEDKEAINAYYTEKVADKILEEIEKNNQGKLLTEIEMPLIKVLADMENAGFMVDGKGIKEFGKKLKTQIDILHKSVMEQVGEEFNLNSPKQLGEALFVKMGLPHGKKTKTGYSTNVEVLEKLKHEAPVVQDILEYRTLTKLNSTYCEGLLKVVGEDGRIHSTFNQAETRTGRISSTEPNLQNIPVRTDLGRELRRFFVAKEGHVLVGADYSQIELRVLADVSKDEVMCEAFREGKDIHRSTAARVFNMPEEMVTSKMRSSAKAVNFGIVYGIGAFSLSQDIGVSRFEAENYINEYLKNFWGIKDYMENVIAKAKEDGYVEDIFGRRRYLPELKSGNFNMRAFGERVARNMPIQGAAADIIKIAMIKVQDALKDMQARLILQVHDELIVECPLNEAEKVQELLKKEMENAVKLSVPLLVDANIGENWYIVKG